MRASLSPPKSPVGWGRVGQLETESLASPVRFGRRVGSWGNLMSRSFSCVGSRSSQQRKQYYGGCRTVPVMCPSQWSRGRGTRKHQGPSSAPVSVRLVRSRRKWRNCPRVPRPSPMKADPRLARVGESWANTAAGTHIVGSRAKVSEYLPDRIAAKASRTEQLDGRAFSAGRESRCKMKVCSLTALPRSNFNDKTNMNEPKRGAASKGQGSGALQG